MIAIILLERCFSLPKWISNDVRFQFYRNFQFCKITKGASVRAALRSCVCSVTSAPSAVNVRLSFKIISKALLDIVFTSQLKFYCNLNKKQPSRVFSRSAITKRSESVSMRNRTLVILLMTVRHSAPRPRALQMTSSPTPTTSSDFIIDSTFLIFWSLEFHPEPLLEIKFEFLKYKLSNNSFRTTSFFHSVF